MLVSQSVQRRLRIVAMIACAVGVLTFAFMWFVFRSGMSYAADGTDYTADIQVIGNVNIGKPAYARNVWDMQEYGGRIYLGHGNSSNASPTAVNAGPIPIVALDPTNNTFTTEYMIDGEEISRLNVIGGSLYVPDDDPRTGGWNLGNLYIKSSPSDSWVMKRTIPGGIHNFDVAEYDGKLWVGIGPDTQYNGATSVQYTEDGGNTWKMGTSAKAGGRVYSLINTGGSLYGIGESMMYINNELRIYGCKITAGQALPPNCYTLLSTINMAGSGVPNGSAIFKNKFDFAGKLVLNTIISGANGTYDDIHNAGRVYYTSSFPNELTQLNMPDPDAQPMDMIQKDGAIYILAHIEHSTTDFTNIIYKTTDLTTVTEVLRFKYGSFARSFEKLSGQDEYIFGIGSKNVASPSALSGDIIRISLNGTVVTAPSNNADLAYISAASAVTSSLTGTTAWANPAISPAFSSDRTSYTFTVAYRFSRISLGRGASDRRATVTTQTNINLNPGNNALALTVTARDGVTKKTYNVNVVRSAPSTVNTLAALSVTGMTSGAPAYALSPKFAAGTLAYAVAVPEDVGGINISARSTSSTIAPVSSPDTDAAMTGVFDGSSMVTTSGTVSNLEKGVPKTVRIVVTAESGAERTYILTVTRAGEPTPPVKTVPTTAQLDYSIPTGVTYTAVSQPISTPTPKAGVTGLGNITVKYAGSGETTYAESTVAPINAGSYTVYADIAEGTEYTAAKLSLGTYNIVKASVAGVNQGFGVKSGIAHTYVFDLRTLLPGSVPSSAVSAYSVSSVSGNIYSMSPSASGYNLSLPVASVAAGNAKSVVTIGFSSSNYNISSAQITVNVSDRTPVEISGVAVASRSYSGVAVAMTGVPVFTNTVSQAVVDGLTAVYVWKTAAGGVLASAPVDAGNYQLLVSADGGLEYDVTDLELDFSVTKADQTINFVCPVSGYVGDVINLSASTSIGLTDITFQSRDAGVAAVSGSTLTFVGVGTTTITAMHAGNANYGAASSDCVVNVAVTDEPEPEPDYGVRQDFSDFDGEGHRVAIINAEVTSFVRLTLDGESVLQDYYLVTEGSTVIMLREEYLVTLEAGEYAFVAEFAGGVTVPLGLTILTSGGGADDDGIGAPVTGVIGFIADGGPLSVGLIALVAVAGVGTVRWLVLRRR